METYDVLDETGADENLLSPDARKKARHMGFWMIVSAAAGLVIFGGLTFLFVTDNGVDADEVEEVALLTFFLCMIFKYALLLISAIQTRSGANSMRSHLLYKAVFNARIVWIFTGILAAIFLLQVVLYYAFGFEMFGEITRDLFWYYNGTY